jgi:hypothetical protein
MMNGWKKYKMKKYDEKDDFLQIADKLISEQKLGEALNYLQKIIETDNKNEKALILMEQVKKIVEYQNRDIFGSTNLDMDPWLE